MSENQIRRDDLSQAVRDACGNLSRQDAGKAVAAIFDTIQASLQQGKEVAVNRFGRFSIDERKASTGRNPRTGEEIQIPAHRVVKFKSAKDFLGD